MNPSHPAPFPWRSLESVTLAEAIAFRDAKRWASSVARFDAVAESLRDLLDADVKVLVTRVQARARAPARADWMALRLVRADAPEGSPGALLEVEAALAAHVAARALRRSPARAVRASTSPSPDMAGSFAAVLLAAARRAHGTVALRALSAGRATDVAGDAPAPSGDLVVSLTVLVGDDAFAARAVVPTATWVTSAIPPWDRGALMALGSLPLALPVVVWTTRATVVDLASLRPGDGLVLAPQGLAAPPPPAGAKRGRAGPVWLAPPSADVGLAAQLGEDGRVVLRGGVEPLFVPEAPMNPEEKEDVVAVMGDVPVRVRVEIGEAVMSARDWASVGRGDVVGLGRRLGEPVVVRVEGIALARGELVDLEGEVAVRILERISGRETAT